MKPVIVEDAAGDELREACAWYEARRPGLSLNLIDEFDDALSSTFANFSAPEIAAFPGVFDVVTEFIHTSTRSPSSRR